MLNEIEIHKNFDQVDRSLKEQYKNIGNVLKEMFGSRVMTTMTVLLMFSIFSVGMGSYGIHFAAKFSSLDIFVTVVMKAGFGFLMILICMFLLIYVSRNLNILITAFINLITQ